MNKKRITINPEICNGKPVIRGLRYPVEMILELLSAGMTIEEILADYEDLEREDILAVMEADSSLPALMDEISDNAQERGLTAEILESLLKAEE